MSNWEKVRIGDVCRLIPGFAFKSSDLVNDGIPVVKIGNITDTYTVNVDTQCCLPKEKYHSQLDKFRLFHKDIVVAMTGATAGKMGRMSLDADTYVLLNQRVLKILPEKIDSDFFWATVANQKYRRRFYELGIGAAQPNFSATQLGTIEIPFPPLPVQRRIAGILSAYDDLIEVNRHRIANLEATARLAYRKWFGGTEDIRTTTLGEIAPFVRGRMITQKNAIPGHVPVVAGGLEPAYYHNAPNTGSPVITISGSGANAGFTRMYFEPIWASDCSWCDKATAKWFYFVYCFLKDNADSLRNLQQGAAQPHVYPKDINALAVALPISNTVLNKFESAVEPLFEQCGVLSKQNTALASARDMLLPRLMKEHIIMP